MNKNYLVILSLAAMVPLAISCGSGSPSGPGSTTTHVYKDGFKYSWFGNTLSEGWSGSGTGNNDSYSDTDSISGDGTVLLITQTNSASNPGLFFLSAVDIYDATAPHDMSAYYGSGHLQFDLKLALDPSQFSTLFLHGRAGGSTNTYNLTPSDYNTSTYTHVSVPIASLYPPSSLTTEVANCFEIGFTITTIGTNLNTLLIDDIKWTTN